MNYRDSIDYLYSLQKHGIKLGLDNTLRLLSFIDNPQVSFKTVHIAGTNGKGSTSAMTASMLMAAGFNVGLFTSPHLVSFTERIKVNNTEITESEVISLTIELKNIIHNFGLHAPGAKLTPTFFEFVTVMAFLYFKRKGIEWGVIETGMGGRLDATNILRPAACVITKISPDHKEFLGETLRDIAIEKAGIIKHGVPVISSVQDPEALEAIRQKAFLEKSDFFMYGRDFTACMGNADMDGSNFDYTGKNNLTRLFVPLCGVHQIENASVAVRTFEEIMGESVTEDAIREGLAKTVWPGRTELIKMAAKNYDILLDGAHNPSASQALAETLMKYFMPAYKKIILVLGVMADKDIKGLMKPLLPLASDIILTMPDYGRAADPSALAAYAGSFGFASRTSGSVKDALDMAAQIAAAVSYDKNLIVITGSFYTIGEAKAALEHRKAFSLMTGLR